MLTGITPDPNHVFALALHLAVNGDTSLLERIDRQIQQKYGPRFQLDIPGIPTKEEYFNSTQGKQGDKK